MKLRRATAALLLLVAPALLGACDDDDPAAANGGDATESGAPAPGTEGTAASPSVLQPGGFTEEDDVLNVATRQPSTLDPMRIQDPGSVLVARQLYEGLTRWDPVQQRVVPAAAQSWDVGGGGRVYTFHLRQGMTFHDGSPVRAADFRFAFDRIAKKSNASDLAYTLERVQGFPEVNSAGTSDHLTGIRASDDLTLRITLSEPFRGLPAVLTHPGLVPLRAQAVASYDEFLAKPVGNGPFQMAEKWVPGEPVILQDFPGFVETPSLDGIRFVPAPDAAASWPWFVDERIDVAEVPSGQFDAARETYGEDGYKPFLAGYYFGLNVKSGELDRIALRKAISRAIDRREIAESVYKGNMQLPRGIVPAGMPGFQENVCITLCRYSPEIAEKMVADIPPKERRISVQFNREDPHGRVARLVKRDLEAAGFTVRIVGYGFPRYLRLLRDGKQSAYRLGWIAEYPEADVFLSGLFESGSPDNHSGFASPRVDALLAKARRTESEAVRAQTYVQAEKLILAQMPVVPIGSFVTHWAAQPWVDEIEFDVMGGFDAVEVSLEGKPAES
ncbi:MAG TPA: peptide ABC transporter substrate-binding protein [Actinomycetota bacterium]|nr:peptide ABC transporter substrate-binding protein [Actinomycetota bacterium]